MKGCVINNAVSNHALVKQLDDNLAFVNNGQWLNQNSSEFYVGRKVLCGSRSLLTSPEKHRFQTSSWYFEQYVPDKRKSKRKERNGNDIMCIL